MSSPEPPDTSGESIATAVTSTHKRVSFDPDIVTKSKKATPTKMGASGTSHANSEIHPYVAKDLLLCHAVVPLLKWIEVVCGIPEDKMVTWMSQIKEMKWFEDDEIQKSLIEYCSVKEQGRYDPFVAIANRVLLLARGTLAGVPAESSYPINNPCFVNHASKAVERIAEHGTVGAQRKPDVVCVRKPVADKIKEDADARSGWSDILYWCELKYNHLLIDKLRDERVERGLPTLAADGQPVVRAKAKGKAKKGAKKGAKRSTRTKKAPEALPLPLIPPLSAAEPSSNVRAGQKRKLDDREDVDLLAGHQMSSNQKEICGSGPGCDALDGWKAAVQSGAYALELLSCTYGSRAHCLGFVIKDDYIYPWFYDSSGVVYCTQYASLVCDFELSAALLVALACCTPAQLGCLPESIFVPPAPHALHYPVHDLVNCKVKMTDGTTDKSAEVTLKESLFTAYTLVGRRTFLYTAEATPAITTRPIAVKFSYQASTRAKEQDLVARARKHGVKHLPTIHMTADLWKLSDGIRNIFYEASDHSATYEDRILRAIVYTRYASIKHLFAERCDLIPVMVDQMIDCLHDLRYKAKMLHRDVSVNNIMYEIRGEKYYFILIDFDMAIVISDDDATGSSYVASSKHRTGTLPFMAAELIEDACNAMDPTRTPVKHRLLHDLESLYWVALWCVLMVVTAGLSDKQKKALRHRASRWDSGDLESVCSQKLRDSMIKFGRGGIDVSPSALPLRGWFVAWSRIFYKLRGAAFERYATGEENSDESAGGILCRDSLKAALTPHMPIHQDDDDPDTPHAESSTAVSKEADVVGKVPGDALLAAKDFVLGEPVKAPTKSKEKRTKKGSKRTRKVDAPPAAEDAVDKNPSGSRSKTSLAASVVSAVTEEQSDTVHDMAEPALESEQPKPKRAALKKRSNLKSAAPVPAASTDNDIRSRLRPRKAVHYV